MAKPRIIHVTKTDHDEQPFTVRIEDGKTDLPLSGRYVDYTRARKGGVRKADGMKAVKPFVIHCHGIRPRVGEKCIVHARIWGDVEGVCVGIPGDDRVRVKVTKGSHKGQEGTWTVSDITIIRK